MNITATFEVHEPHPRTDRDWEDIYDQLCHAGTEVGLTLMSTITTDQRASIHAYGTHH